MGETVLLLSIPFFVYGLIARWGMDVEETGPRSSIQTRVVVIFRHWYLGPDLILLSIVMHISGNIMSIDRIKGRGEFLGVDLFISFWFVFVALLILHQILIQNWIHAGTEKRFRHKRRWRFVPDTDADKQGMLNRIPIDEIRIMRTLFSREGFRLLILGNAVGVLSLTVCLSYLRAVISSLK